MTVSDVEKKKKRFGVKRWLVLGLVALGIYAAFIGPSMLKPVSPLVVLPGEPTGLYIVPPFETAKPISLLSCQAEAEHYLCSFPITNTILATLLSDFVLILMALAAYRFMKSGKVVPSGFYNAFEAIIEFIWKSVEGAAGKWAKKIFIVPATIFLLIFVANMIKMLPGFESFGYMKESHGSYGYKAVTLIPGALYSIDKGQPISEASATTQGEETHVEETHSEGSTDIESTKYYEIVPFLRGSATDLNFPFALALVAVVMTQVYGVWAVGPGYFEKFFQVRALINRGPFGAIDFAVGFLEIILEFAKILSFGFRLFGNIFAGALLLSIVGALTAVVVPAGLYIFEVFFGIIQAYVFFLLATMFISGATVSHHGGDHH
jgi:F-type H+-transporting ATPase subunit a